MKITPQKIKFLKNKALVMTAEGEEVVLSGKQLTRLIYSYVPQLKKMGITAWLFNRLPEKRREEILNKLFKAKPKKVIIEYEVDPTPFVEKLKACGLEEVMTLGRISFLKYNQRGKYFEAILQVKVSEKFISLTILLYRNGVVFPLPDARITCSKSSFQEVLAEVREFVSRNLKLAEKYATEKVTLDRVEKAARKAYLVKKHWNAVEKIIIEKTPTKIQLIDALIKRFGVTERLRRFFGHLLLV